MYSTRSVAGDDVDSRIVHLCDECGIKSRLHICGIRRMTNVRHTPSCSPMLGIYRARRSPHIRYSANGEYNRERRAMFDIHHLSAICIYTSDVKMSDFELIIRNAAAFVVLSCGAMLKMKKGRRRRWWMVSVNRSRNVYNATNLLADLIKEPAGNFENFCRMSLEDFDFLLAQVEPIIGRKDTNFRKAIPAKERLAVTLRFLATGDSFQSLHYLFKFSPQIISKIIPEVCAALIKLLQGHLKLPDNAEDWKRIVETFENVWNFPHCLGTMDGKHVVIQAPYNSGSEFFNYKQNFSVVFMALVDADYIFIFADCGCQGRISDGGVFKNTVLFQKIENNELHCPIPEPLPGMNTPIPYIFVGDDALGLSTRIMKPFRGQHDKGSKQRVFNYRLSRARRVVENTFRILSAVFRVLRKPILLQPNKVSLVVMTCFVLHNFLRRNLPRAIFTNGNI